MRKVFLLGFALLITSGIAASLMGAGPQGPGKDTVEICHYCDLHNQYNTLTLGTAAANQHLTSHPDDYAGPCK